jgi:hypothetical protein
MRAAVDHQRALNCADPVFEVGRREQQRPVRAYVEHESLRRAPEADRACRSRSSRRRWRSAAATVRARGLELCASQRLPAFVIEREPRHRRYLAQQCAVGENPGLMRQAGDGASAGDDRRDLAIRG